MHCSMLCALLKCCWCQASTISEGTVSDRRLAGIRRQAAGGTGRQQVSGRCHSVKGLFLQIMRVRSVDDFEYHMCPNEDHAWDHIPRDAYAEHSQDTCPECGACRFLQDTLKPAKVREVCLYVVLLV